MPKPARRTGRKPAAVRRRIRKPVASKAPRRKKVLPNERLPELDLIYDTAPVGLAFLSPDCRYVHINQRLTEICGISVADHIGRSVRETVPQVAEQVEQLVEAVLLSGEPITGVEVRGQRADGLNADHVWITNWHPLKSSDGSVVGVNVVAEDITERTRTKAMLAASESALRDSEVRFRELKDAENELREARRELAQVARRTTLAAMTAAIAHEMKQPLGAIVTNANAGLRWLDRSPPDLTEIRDALMHIAADGHRASDVIQSVRAVFTKGDQVGSPLDANELVRETIGILRPELEAAKIAVCLNLAPQLPLLHGHKIQLQQVVLNIVSNAADAMRTVTDRPKVLTVKSAPNDWGGVAITIEDSGIGIEPEYAGRVLRSVLYDQGSRYGYGLGDLPIDCRGSRRKPVDVAGLTAWFGAPRIFTGEQMTPRGGAAQATPVVFVIDDDDSVRTALSSLIRSVGLRVETFASASEFVAAKRPDSPSCLILDVRLPGVSGLDFQTELAKTNTLIPIIFITGHGDIPMSVKAMKAGAVEFLTKPFRDQDLLDAIQVALERSRSSQESEKAVSELKARFDTLTPREQEVMARVTSGLLNKQVAAEIGVSEITVKVHRGNVTRKMGAKSFAELVRMADALGIRRPRSQ